jgi:hypothetical protein
MSGKRNRRDSRRAADSLKSTVLRKRRKNKRGQVRM